MIHYLFNSTSSETDMIPAIPPDDYTGSISDWMCWLQDMGLWDGEGWYGDILLTEAQYTAILDECESN